ncbi:response regulator [Actinophytocola sp.]|jgi:response regulator of citrate/malate metabolism|uniref:response regulator n=1 Tax=Actinophytocola sp. TaxID=1872138 RepID=UPI002EDBA379
MIGVLVVDDDFNVARIHCGYVGRTPGFRVVGAAHTGKEAVAAIRELEPDLVLLDLYLPDMFGLDVVTRLRSTGQDCDVLVISAAKDSQAIRACIRQGVVNYLLKPFTVDDLRERLQRYASQRASLDASTVDTQADVDRMLTQTVSRATTVVLPKGLSVHTAELVGRALRAATGTLSAAECAGRVGLSRVTARLYLEHLRETGRAEVTLRYHATGRPERRYHWIS